MRDSKLGLRRLCARECAAIQTFPNDWAWESNNTVRYRLIGNAVPPRLAKAVGDTLVGFARSEEASTARVVTRLANEIAPLPLNLQAAVAYTMREERTNGASRRMTPAKRRSRIQVVNTLPGCCDG